LQYKADKSSGHENSSDYQQPMWILEGRHPSFPLRFPGWLLARVFREDMQDRFHHGPYRLRASQGGVLRCNPGIERGKLIGLQADLYRCALAGWDGPAFLWLHSLLCHRNRGTT